MVSARTMTLVGMGIVLVAGLGGCNGPGKTGMEMREKSRNRVAMMNSQLTYDQASRAFDVGRFERALREIDAAIEAYPELAEYHVLRGRIYLETHRLERSIDSFLTALEYDDENPEAHYCAGIVYQRWSDDEQAYEHYTRAYELEEDNVSYLLAAAEALVALGELESSRQLLEPKVEYFEHNSALHHLLGQIELLQGNLNEAAESYNRAHMLRPDDRQLHEELARVQYQAELYQECHDTVFELESQVEDPPVELTLLRARCLAMLERLPDAREAYVGLTRVDPSNVDVWIELGTIAWEMEDYHRVAQCSVRTISLMPERFEGYMLKGINERHHGNVENAIDLFRQAAVRTTDSPMPHILLGLTLEQSGDSEAALLAYSDAVRIDPESREAEALRERLLERGRLSAAPSNG